MELRNKNKKTNKIVVLLLSSFLVTIFVFICLSNVTACAKNKSISISLFSDKTHMYWDSNAQQQEQIKISANVKGTDKYSLAIKCESSFSTWRNYVHFSSDPFMTTTTLGFNDDIQSVPSFDLTISCQFQNAVSNSLSIYIATGVALENQYEIKDINLLNIPNPTTLQNYMLFKNDEAIERGIKMNQLVQDTKTNDPNEMKFKDGDEESIFLGNVTFSYTIISKISLTDLIPDNTEPYEGETHLFTDLSSYAEPVYAINLLPVDIGHIFEYVTCPTHDDRVYWYNQFQNVEWNKLSFQSTPSIGDENVTLIPNESITNNPYTGSITFTIPSLQ